ncbi:MAG TPA: hypothetical protein VN238_17955, partial [Solirubrobacteraceae bacterium]|nr:hypothetical protein [Solirubrobacteraceae bacterium]
MGGAEHRPPRGIDLELNGILQVAALAGLPIVLLVAMRRGGFAHAGGVEGLARALGPGNATLRTTE